METRLFIELSNRLNSDSLRLLSETFTRMSQSALQNRRYAKLSSFISVWFPGHGRALIVRVLESASWKFLSDFTAPVDTSVLWFVELHDGVLFGEYGAAKSPSFLCRSTF